jgi:hypothetical protein
MYISMILLITAAAKAQELLPMLEQAIGQRVQVAATLCAATRELRNGQFTAVVFDECLLESEPEEGEVALNATDGAICVFVNFAISGTERLLHQVRAALRRRESECSVAQREAEALLRSELNEALTGILLSSELALAVPDLPHAAEAKLRSVYQLATNMRARLEAHN